MKRFLIIPFLTTLLITTASATNGGDSAVPSADKHPRTTATDSNIFGHVIIAGKGEPILTYRDEVVTETRQSNRRRALRTKNNDIA